MNKKLLVLETNSNIANAEIIRTAHELGVYVVVTGYTPAEDSVVKQLADESWDISTVDIHGLVAKCRDIGIDGVFGGTDFAVDVAIALSESLGIPYYCDREAWHYSRNKVDFKQRCREFGVPIVPEVVLGPGEEIDCGDIDYPVVVKPCDRSGNVGISFCHDSEQLLDALNSARERAENGQVIIEKYMTGMGYTPFYVLADGEPRLLYFSSMLNEPGMPTNCYTISTTAVSSKAMKKYLTDIDPHVRALLKGIGCRDGVAWLELMTDERGDFYAIEMGHRLSGEMLWASMPQVRSFSPLHWMVNYAVNGLSDQSLMPPAFDGTEGKVGCGYILWTRSGGIVGSIEGLSVIERSLNATVHEVAKIGAEIDPYSYALIVSFKSDSKQELCKNIRLINSEVSMKDIGGDEMLSYFTDFDSILTMD